MARPINYRELIKMKYILIVLALLLLAGISSAEVIKGQSTDLGVNTYTWNNTNFAWFVGDERITTMMHGVNASNDSAVLSDQPDWNNVRGITYVTTAQLENFEYKPWGQYEAIGFLGEMYFVAYNNRQTPGMMAAGQDTAILWDQSTYRNLMTTLQIDKILLDNNTKTTIDSDTPLKLKEGYELDLRSVDLNEHQALVELLKNGKSVNKQIVRVLGGTMNDQTYAYRLTINGIKPIVIMGVHFSNVFHDGNMNSATIDGIFQISDTPILLKFDQPYDKMSITNVDATGMTITMGNKDIYHEHDADGRNIGNTAVPNPNNIQNDQIVL